MARVGRCFSVATFKEGEDQAGYWPDAKPETHKVGRKTAQGSRESQTGLC